MRLIKCLALSWTRRWMPWSHSPRRCFNYAAHQGKGRVKMVGDEFNVRPVAIGMQVDSPLRRKIDRALIAPRDDGTYQQLYNKWLGGS